MNTFGLERGTACCSGT